MALQEDEARNQRRRTLNRRLLIVAVALVLLTSLVALGSLLYEVLLLRSGRSRMATETSGSTRNSAGKQAIELRPGLHPLDLLPPVIEGFTTTARQRLPGRQGYAAEAFYTSKNEDLSPAAPFNTYVRIIFHQSSSQAAEEIKRSGGKRYPVAAGTVDVASQSMVSGYEAGRGAYFLGWTLRQYSIEVDTSYTIYVPPSGGTALSEVSRNVAAAVKTHAERTISEGSN